MPFKFDSHRFGTGSRKSLAYRMRRSAKSIKWREVFLLLAICAGLYALLPQSQLNDFPSRSMEPIISSNQFQRSSKNALYSSIDKLPRTPSEMVSPPKKTVEETKKSDENELAAVVGKLPRITREKGPLPKQGVEGTEKSNQEKMKTKTYRSKEAKPALALSFPARTNPPIILVWKAMEYQMKRRDEFLEYYMPMRCGGCQVTTDRSVVRDCAALIHFNSPDLRKAMDVPDPKDRNSNQIYAFWSRETPAKTHHFSNILRDKQLDSVFNLTINFRHDSDIIDYFGNSEYELRVSMDKRELERILSSKTDLAVWAVSNCNSTYGATMRMKYAKKLMKAGLKITAYGSCFNNKNSGKDFIQELERHKFYISFENSIHCPDYVSEKFWRNGLRLGTVPIVWGPTREDVAKVAPPHSYIHVDDFSSARKLVEYINYLDKNDTAYWEYHAWRSQPADWTIPYEDIIPSHWSTFCRLCKKVVEQPLQYKTVPSIADWLYKTGYVDNLCFK